MINDFKLTGFACYLAVMNGDISHPKVANAQAYSASLEEIHIAYQSHKAIIIAFIFVERDTDREKILNHLTMLSARMLDYTGSEVLTTHIFRVMICATNTGHAVKRYFFQRNPVLFKALYRQSHIR